MVRIGIGKIFVLTVVVAALNGCGDDPVAPTLETIVGTYQATAFTANDDDILAAGGSLTLTFTSDGMLEGSLFVPAEVGGPLDANMVGSFSLSGTTVTISQDADTFVRDAEWTWDDGVLTGAWSNGDDTVEVRLSR